MQGYENCAVVQWKTWSTMTL